MKRGEIWLVNLDPMTGAEIQKTRPAVIVSNDALGKLPL
ncbi:MAG: type II toxin-antitoxin system PemK/MazF family toxin, partial [Pelolinea sp.]|nr:type II toxin-antitoxin system PemK/MazF family toxin [Pelolinea sp.]